jgi:hypothetical protein
MNNLKNKKLTTIQESNLKTNLAAACYLTAICTICFTTPAYADWFKVGDIKANLITPVYTLVSDNLGFVAFAAGGGATFLARGQDMWQKAIAFGVGSLGTAGSVKLAQTVLHLA